MRLGNGAAQPPPHDAEPGAPPSRPKRLNLTMPPGLVDGSVEDELLTLIVGPLDARASAAAYAFVAANGLAG
jgi:hypothetical protein